MQNPSFSLLEALQLTGLLPSLFIAVLLLFIASDWKKAIVPVSYFLCLSCSFLLPLQHVINLENDALRTGLIFAETLQPALCFLLIMQFLTGDKPRAFYWLILSVPVIGGSSMLYSSMITEEFCLNDHACVSSSSFRMLYNIFAGSLIFLLLVVQFRFNRPLQDQRLYRHHKYWLVVSLIGLYLALLALDLAYISERISETEHLMAGTVIRISFIYLVLTSLFRVFDKGKLLDSGKTSSQPRPVDPALIVRLEQAMQEENVYREMGCSRESLAKHMGIGEHVLSRAVNQHYGKNFSEFINSYRVEEAKIRLVHETTPVTAIAFEVGFSSIASFNRVFKSLAGCSPTEYRSQGGNGLKTA